MTTGRRQPLVGHWNFLRTPAQPGEHGTQTCGRGSREAPSGITQSRTVWTHFCRGKKKDKNRRDVRTPQRSRSTVQDAIHTKRNFAPSARRESSVCRRCCRRHVPTACTRKMSSASLVGARYGPISQSRCIRRSGDAHIDAHARSQRTPASLCSLRQVLGWADLSQRSRPFSSTTSGNHLLWRWSLYITGRSRRQD